MSLVILPSMRRTASAAAAAARRRRERRRRRRKKSVISSINQFAYLKEIVNRFLTPSLPSMRRTASAAGAAAARRRSERRRRRRKWKVVVALQVRPKPPRANPARVPYVYKPSVMLSSAAKKHSPVENIRGRANT